MKWEVVLSIIAIVISIFSLIFFSVFPAIKKYLIRKTFVSIRTLYNWYETLNPCFLNNINEITKSLIYQNVFIFGFPKFNVSIQKNYDDFDPFAFENSSWFDTLSFFEVLRFLHFWKLMTKKIKKIAKTLDKYKYIVSLEGVRGIFYTNPYLCRIVKTSITFCPGFDQIRLFGSICPKPQNYVENKINLNEHIKNYNSDVKFLNELKKDLFSLNIKFKSISSSINYSYSLNFNGKGEVCSIKTFWIEQNKQLNKTDEQEVSEHLSWLKNTFNISDIDEKIMK